MPLLKLILKMSQKGENSNKLICKLKSSPSIALRFHGTSGFRSSRDHHFGEYYTQQFHNHFLCISLCFHLCFGLYSSPNPKTNFQSVSIFCQSQLLTQTFSGIDSKPLYSNLFCLAFVKTK